MDHLTSMKFNGLIPELTGLPKLPGTRAMRDFILNMTQKDLAQIERAHDIIRQKIFQYPNMVTSATLDFDSSVLTVYGNQELAEVGYNPFKHGRKSYHPLFGFESHLSISLAGELRPGKQKDKEAAIPLIKAALQKIPATIATSRTRVRADAGFYCWQTIKFLDENHYGFAIVAQVTGPIKKKLPGLRYRVFNHQYKLAIAEFRYQPLGWEKSHRFIVMRYRLPPEPETSQRTLLKMDRYEYHVFVTNLDLDPEYVWYFYNDRAAVEINIKELKTDFFMSKIPTRIFFANHAHLKLLLLDFDLFRWFQMLCLPEKLQSRTLRWIRRNILVAPARFTTPGHRNILKFQKNHPNEKLLKQIFQKALRVRSLLK